MNLIGLYAKWVIVLILPSIIRSQIDPIEQPQCIIEGQTSVICRTYEDFDIREEFELISSTHPNDEKLFDQLIIYYLPVLELPDNTFFDLQFTQISVHETYNLTQIHTNAFNSTSAVTENLYLIGTKVLVNNPPEYDLYAAISSLTNLKTVTINLNDDLKHEIPENAFRQINGPQNDLEVIAFRGDFVISRINNNAFSAIPNLRRWILFSFIQIESISSGAFDFAQTSTDRLELHFKGCGLNETSFEDNVFSGSQRPLYVDLDSNQIRYIQQNTFSSFFSANPNNSISLANNPLDCDNTQQIQWLLDQRDELQNRVLNAACSDGTLLWDIGFDNQCDATTDTTEVICTVNGSLALKSEFKRIAQANPTQTYYNRLIIEENPVFTVIPEDVFMGLSFGDIFIDSSPNLMNIHRNAFASTVNTTHRFWLSTITQLRDSPPEFDLYYALSTLTNATYIVIALDASLTHLIPDNAFRNINGVQSSIFEILFQGNFRISRIGNNAFYEIPSLQELVFEYTPITRIASRAFDFRTSSEVTLEIHLPGCQLTDQSFEPNMFNGSQRPLLIDLRNNLINYLDENIYSSFLAADNRNQMNLFGNFLNCSDINRFTWLLQQKDQLESQILDAGCVDGTNFWDLELPASPPTGTAPTTIGTGPTQTTTEGGIDPIEQPQCIIEGQTSVICRTYEDFDIREEFELISSTHPNDEKLFDQLIIYYLPVLELPDNTFFDLQFTQISVHETYNLTQIHTNAFNSTSAVTENLYLIGTKVLVNNPPEYDLYAAISSLTNLKTVTINLNDDLKHEIPENAFRQINGPQNDLEVIAFRGDFVISRINNNAFSAIPNLRRWILFSYIQIESISSGAFDFVETSADRLELHFKGCGLNETSFEDNVFSGSQRPLYVDLDSNQIRYISEATFSSFFSANPNNSISLANNPLDCDNTQQFQWLFDQRDQLQNRVLNAACSDGTLLWDIGFDNQCDATTDTTEVVCSVNGSLALKSEFKRIAQANPTQTYYNRLIIEENPVFTVIPEDVFIGLSFGDIFIDSSPNLMNIHRNAFTSTANTTHRFWLSTLTQLRNTPPEYDVYYALSTLTNATFLLLAFDPSVTHSIPDNAFRNVNGVQSSIYEILFEGNFTISRIGNNAFSVIPNIEFLVFEVGRIATVSSRAFDFSTSSETSLRINLHSSQLTHQSFEDNVFSGSQRPLIVDLDNNQINYIDNNTFSAFLAADQRNELILSRNALNCTDIERFTWLLDQREQLESRVTSAVCSDGTNFWDLLTTPTPPPVTITTTIGTGPTQTTTEGGIDPIEQPQCIIEGQTSVICRTYEDFDIREEFELISSTHPNDEKLFDQLIIYYLPVLELPDNTFFDLQFTQISVHETYNLTQIHTNAFNSTSAVTENLYLIGTKVLVNNPPEYDLYAAISSLTNLKTVTINLNDDLKHEIPENAFRQINGPQNDLEVIAFRGDFVISRINNNAFSAIPNLRRWILFSYIQIESISSGAFDFVETSADRLELHFKGCGLNETSFEDNVFSGSQRPLYVDLDSNQIRYIQQNTFSSFFTANPNNSISLANNPLDCDNTQQIQWLLDQRDELQNRVLNAACSDGTLLWDIGFDNQCDATTDTTEVVCSVNGSLALKSEFKRIAQANPTQTYYNRLYVEDYPVFTVIPDDVFIGLSFGDIFIDSSPNLMNIHRNAFISTANTTHRFWLSTLTQLRNTPPEYDVYYALSTLVNATFLLLAFDPSVSHLIPDNAFRNVNGVQTSLYEILFEGNFTISRIGNNAFYEIPSLEFIVFEVGRITTVSSRAFDFSTSSETTLRINIHSSELTHQSLEDNVFSGSQRPLIVDLADNLVNYIDNNTFSAFLAADPRNELVLAGNLLNCTDIERFMWLLDQREQLESRVTDAMCSDGTNFWDLLTTPTPPPVTITTTIGTGPTQTTTEGGIDPIEQPQCIIEGQTSVICRTYEDFDIREEFELISSTHPNDEKLFDQLIIYYLPVLELPDNTFFDLQFTQISVHETYNLTQIHTNAFNSTSAVTENLYLIGTKVLVNNPPEYDLYAAISSLTNLKTVTINLNDDLKHEIPENAFRQINGPQNDLEVIAFRGDFVISRINNNAFSAIPNLRRWILFSYIQIESISSGAFDFVETSADRLELHFKGCGLNETSFEDNVFSGSQRPLYVDLDSNQIRYISEATFSSFFSANPNNSISLANNPLDCDNTQQFQWLFDQRDQLQNRVLNAACSDGTLLWDIGFDNQCDATTDTTEVVCSVNGSLALKSEFKRIAQANPTQTYYNRLIIEENPVFTVIPEDVFIGLSFGDIFIDSSPNLMNIHRNAFTSTANTTHRFWLSTLTQLRNTPPEYDVYYALSTLTNATFLLLAFDPSVTHSIPDNAFRNVNGVQSSIYEILFEGNFTISRIGNNAFSVIPNIEFLVFEVGRIATVSSRAFDFSTSSETSLRINLHSSQLTHQSFEDNVFSGSQRPLIVDLDNNQINYIDNNTFSAFLAADQRNELILSRNALNCTDIERFTWLLDQREQLESRVTSAVCSDGTNFWDLLTTPTPPPVTITTTIGTGPTQTTTEGGIDPIEQPQCIIEGQTSVICRTYEDFDIREEFELISSTHPNDEKLFDQLIIYYLPVLELPDNTFFDLQFTQISVHETYNLTQIHTNAFNSTSAVTENLYLIGTKVLVNNPPEYDLYAAISSLTNLKTVTINLNDDLKHEIPENAFRQINGPQNDLEVIAFRGDFVISRINNNAFSAIPNLRRWILFSYIQIESISSGAFDFVETSADRLELHFKGCGLNETSFEDNVFSGSQRPLYVDLDSNQIRYIQQNTFSSFFTANPNNSISLANNPLDCDNTQQIQWLLDQRDELQNRVLNAACSDGTLLWDIGFDNQCDATTDTTEVVCSVNGSLALKSEFKRIAQANPTQTYYNRLYVEDYPVFTVIPDDVFIGLSFGDIFIDSSPNLMNIHRNAFISTANTTHRFWLSTLTQLRNTPPEYDVYYALSTLVNATFLLLAFDPSVSHLIPDNAFRNVNGVQTSLYEILFEGNFTISRIGNNAFYEIPSLEFIVFEVGRITTVSSRAFDFSTSSETTLRINIHSSELTHQSLEDNVFSGSQRPLIVDLADNLVNYIDNNTFSAFLAADPRNELVLAGNLLNCTDIERFMWLLDQREQLESRVTDAMCSDGTNFWDLLTTPTPPPVTTPTIPPPEGICDVNWPEDIVCRTEQLFDIRAEFQRISNSQSNDEKHFQKLLIYYVPISELPENAFYDISFTEIDLHEMFSLTTINTNAFSGTANSTENLLLSETNALINNPPNGDLYSAISSLNNLKTVTIDLANNMAHDIPTDAFKQINGPQNTLEEIAFRGAFSIARINDNAFSAIPNLRTWFIFSFVPVHYISSQAFDFDQPSNDRLEIHLNGCGLNQTSFDNNVFSGSQRPLYIDLNTNQLQYIRENSFRAFIDANPANNVTLQDNPLECDDISEFEWILSRRSELQSRVLNAFCSNGTALWDLELPSSPPPVTTPITTSITTPITTSITTPITTPVTTPTIPPPEGICDVNWPEDIVCRTEQLFDIRAEFQRISNSQSNDEKHFQKLLIYYVPISELPENAFYDISFTEIDLHEMFSLTTINTNAFSGTANSTENLLLSETNALINNPPNGDLYSAISSLNNLKTVTIDLANNMAHDIPTDAFKQINGPQNTLEEIAFRGAFSIARINDNAFSAIPNLRTWFLFSFIPVHSISSRAFDFDQPSNDRLEIHLNGCGLNQTSFDNNVFSGSQRPLYIDLNTNQLQYIRESSFKAFIDANPANNVTLQDNPLECDEITEFQWILSRRSELQNRVLNAVCSNGTALWDLVLPPSIACYSAAVNYILLFISFIVFCFNSF